MSGNLIGHQLKWGNVIAKFPLQKSNSKVLKKSSRGGEYIGGILQATIDDIPATKDENCEAPGILSNRPRSISTSTISNIAST
jgi:hypothetical protein